MSRILVTGGSGVLGRATVPALRDARHTVDTPASAELDLFDPDAVARAVRDADVVLHLATRIPPPERMNEPGAWELNDRLRAEATGILVDAGLGSGLDALVVPTVTFLYPPGPADESTPLADVPQRLRSALAEEAHAERFARGGGRGIVLRLGSLYGPGAAFATPSDRYASHLSTEDAGRAFVAALGIPSGTYNVVDDGDVSHARFTALTGWRPTPSAG